MKINVRLSDLLRKCANWQENIEVTGDTPIECLSILEDQFPDMRVFTHDKQGNLLPQVQFYVNNERVYTDELTSPLKDGDEILIILAIGGG